MEKHSPSKGVDEVFFALCKSIDSPRSLGTWLRFKHGEYHQLVSDAVSPGDYLCAESFRLDYLITEYLSKAEMLRIKGIDRKAEALRKFETSESQCRVTNRRFRVSSSHEAFEGIIHDARRKITQILDTFNVVELQADCRWGPGATFDISKESASGDQKFSVIPSCTYGALPYGKAWVASCPGWFEILTNQSVAGPFSVLDAFFCVVPGNRVTTVPKNAKSERTIGMEPTVNSFLQQGAGRYIRRRLKRFGVDLDNQEINKSWASLASDFDLATLDLSAASDTISKEIVFELLPLPWAQYLDSIRSKSYFMDGRWHMYEKFSSMGNAFTFELESLIFYALLWACTIRVNPRLQWSCSVYGDDIICHQSVAPLLTDVLAWCGFSVNLEKSHVQGQFFESCGGHYFGDVDVTPCYQKAPLRNEELVRAHNRLIRFGLRSLGGLGVDRVVLPAVRCIERLCSDRVMSSTCLPTFVESDDGFVRPWSDASRIRFSPNHGWRCPVFSRPVLMADRHQKAGVVNSLLQLSLGHIGVVTRKSLKRTLYGGMREMGFGAVRHSKRWIVIPPDHDWVDRKSVV